ncbi:MAG: AGE family epimerase/isomerase [Hyphomonadaceae bacterium]
MAETPFDEVRAWISAALPFWAEHGVDREHGGFLEEVGFDGAPTACAFKRVRVICRQTYVFAHAAEQGWAPGAELSRFGSDYLIAKAKLEHGWARALSREGAVIDATNDLYDIAFVLFALAWRYRVSRDPEVLRHLHATLDFVQTHMRGPVAGFWPELPARGERRQNPHMHLTEASLAAFEATQDQRFLDQADELVALFRAHVFDGVTLGEHFDADWRRTGGENGRTLEPGHHFEWAWILAQHQRLAGGDVSGEARALVAFAERTGVDASSHAVYDAVRDDGAPLRKSSRAWTNTERIKGWLALSELTGEDARAPVTQSLRLLFDRYCAGQTPGLWVDQFDGEGRPLSSAVPASIVYHLLLAFYETLRLEPRLKAQAP